MHREDIKALIRKSGSSGASIARQAELSKAAVSNVISGNTKSARVARLISSITSTPVSKLWPGKYPEVEFLESVAIPTTPPKRATTPKRRAAA